MSELINQHDPQGRPHGVWEGYRPDGTVWGREYWLHGQTTRNPGTLLQRRHTRLERPLPTRAEAWSLGRIQEKRYPEFFSMLLKGR